MKITLNWLKQYVDFDWSPEQLAERLTMLGLEVEAVHKVGGEFDGIVIAQILTRDPVPGSDKLSVCKVNDGKGERTIVCGAQNHKPGDKVPLALPGTSLPLKPGEKEPFVIKERKVFGITSHGMMCSPQELGLPDKVDGILIFPANAKIGQPFAEYLGRSRRRCGLRPRSHTKPAGLEQRHRHRPRNRGGHREQAEDSRMSETVQVSPESQNWN